MMKISLFATLALIACANNSASAQSTSVTPGGTQFYGNVIVTGSGACSAIGTKVLFPATASYENVTISGTTKQRFVLKTLAQNATNDLTLQYIVDQFDANDNMFAAFDPQLFQTSNGVIGTYTGSITFGPSVGINGNTTTILLGNSQTPLVTSAQGCVIQFSGTLYSSPD